MSPPIHYLGTEIPLGAATWRLRTSGEKFPRPAAYAAPTFYGLESDEPLACAHCGHGYDKSRLGVVMLSGGEYENKWFWMVRGDVQVSVIGCLYCGGISGVAVGEHKGVLRVGYIYTDDVILPGEKLRDSNEYRCEENKYRYEENDA
jgi:hypothetical protein